MAQAPGAQDGRLPAPLARWGPLALPTVAPRQAAATAARLRAEA
jgi:hypothetical protein